MLYIFDNTFPDDKLAAVQEWAENLPYDDTWFDLNELSYGKHLFDMATKYFDLLDTIGCEMHINYDEPDPHHDKDEDAWFDNKQLIHPLCSIVYYPKIEKLQGGKLVFPNEGVVITPKTNRTVFFRSDLLHAGTPFKGTRQSIGINPWRKKPLAYTRA